MKPSYTESTNVFLWGFVTTTGTPFVIEIRGRDLVSDTNT
jgi:hypothetical protein